MIVDLNLKGRQVAIAGGGREATQKVEAILSQNCDIFVHAERFSTELARWQKQGRVQLISEVLSGGAFLKNYDRLILVLAATDDKSLNREIVASAKKLRCYAYAVDDPEISDYNHPAVMNIQETVQVANFHRRKKSVDGKNLKAKNSAFT